MMKKIRLFGGLLLSAAVLLAGCGVREEVALLPDEVKTVDVTYCYAGQITEWELEQDAIDAFQTWAAGLSLEHQTFAEGQSPGDTEGGSAYDFDVNQGETTFSYVDSGSHYIVRDGEWYLVTNPSEPPIIDRTSPETETQPDSLPVVEPEEVTVSGTEGTISIRIPDGWLWEICPEDSGELLVGEFGIRFWPEDAGEGYIELAYVEMFGVCGTGLEEKEISLAGDQAWVGTYDGRETWDFIAFRGENDGIVAQSFSAGIWLGNYGDEALAILDTLQFTK